jgi:hypothetical protein
MVSTSARNSCSPGSLPPPVEVAVARRDEPEKEQGRERHVRGLPRGGLCGPALTQRVAARLVRALDADPDQRNPARDRSSAMRPSSRWCGATTSSPIPCASRCQKTTAFTARSVNRSNTAQMTPVPRHRHCNSGPRRNTGDAARVTANARSRRAGALLPSANVDKEEEKGGRRERAAVVGTARMPPRGAPRGQADPEGSAAPTPTSPRRRPRGAVPPSSCLSAAGTRPRGAAPAGRRRGRALRPLPPPQTFAPRIPFPSVAEKRRDGNKGTLDKLTGRAHMSGDLMVRDGWSWDRMAQRSKKLGSMAHRCEELF